MKPPLFEYCAPRTLSEAVALLAGDSGAMILAGGQSLIPAMNMRFAAPSRLIDIQHVDGLKGISLDGDRIVVKAMTRHRELECSDLAHNANPLIREALAHVAHIPIRNRGTTVGSLCHADAAAEMPTVLLVTDGSVVAEGPGGRREIPAKDFFEFHMTTTRAQDEIIVEARFGALPKGGGWAFEEFTRRHGDYAIAAVAAMISLSGNKTNVALAACGVASRPVRLTASEQILSKGDFSPAVLQQAADAAKDVVTAPDDMHATTIYRRDLLGALLQRAVKRAVLRMK